MRPLFFLFKSEKKTDEEHLKQMREGLRNNFCLFGHRVLHFVEIFMKIRTKIAKLQYVQMS